MPSTIKEKLSHQSITVKTASKPTPFGTSGQKLSFASDTKSYVCFISALFGDIIVGNTIDADVEVRESGEYINNVVTQIYKEGKPIVGKKPAGSYPPHIGGHTPEERASIENQVRAKIIAELWIGKAIDEKHPLVTKLTNWLGVLNETPQAPISPVNSEIVPEVVRQAQESITMIAVAEKQVQEEAHRTVKDLIDIAKEKDIDPNQVTTVIIRQFKKAKASELEPKQVDWLYQQMADGKMKVADKKEKK